MRNVIMRKLRGNNLILIMILSLGMGLVSCGNSDTERQGSITDNVSQKAGTVQLYHATDSSVEPDEARYQLKQPDNQSAALEEVIEAMTLDPMVTIERYSLEEDKEVTLYIRYDKEITEEIKLLNDAAIVKSIENLDFTTVYVITLGEDDRELETATYTDSSFYYYNE